MALVKVFIQNEAGSDQKHIHDEKRLVHLRTATVSRAYPYPYGFILDTTTEDGCNLDCYVLTRLPLKSGQLVECEVVGLMEQLEDGQEDHNILATLPGESATVDAQVQRVLADFVTHVFDHILGKKIAAGKFLGKEEALAHIARCAD